MTDVRAEHWTTSDGLVASYLASGTDGKPLVFVHGGGSRAAHFAPIMAMLANDTAVFAPDLRGFGNFAVERGAAISFAVWAKDICDFIEELGRGPVILCGWSLGATLALIASAERPDLVNRLVLFGAPDPQRKVDGSFFERRLERLEQGVDANVLLSEIRPHIAAMVSPHADDADAVVAQVLAEQGDNFAGLRETTRAYFTRPALAPIVDRVVAPTVLVTGADDKTCDVAGAEALCGLLRSCDVVRVPRCGHYYFLERPAEMAAILIEILQAPHHA